MENNSNDLEHLVPGWLTIPDAADLLGLNVVQVRRLLEDRTLVAVRVGERGILQIPADFLADGEPVPALRGTLSVLADSGFSDEEAVRWLFTEDESLPGTPMAALRAGRKTEIRRRAQALAF